MGNQNYYEMYHCHTELSLLDSVTKYQEYVDLAVANGQKTLSRICSLHAWVRLLSSFDELGTVDYRRR